MAGKGKIVKGALGALTDAASKVLPDNIFELPSFKEATRAFKKSFQDENEGFKFGEFKYDDAELDANQISTHSLDAGDDLQLISYDESGYGGALKDWYDGKIELEELGMPQYSNFGGTGSEYLPPSNYPLDPLSYIIKDLQFNYNMSKDDIIRYFDKNNALPKDFKFKGKEFDFNEQQMQALKDAFASGDPNNPIVKRVRGALADLTDEDDLVEVTPEMIYGKPN
jgi:hypothetical protein